MRSRVLKIYDLTQAVNEWDWKSCADGAAVDEKINLIALKYKSYKKVEKAERGDLVALTMQSGTKKFNRALQLKVGDGLFDKEFEEELIGKGVGRYEYSRENLQVDYTITEITRLVVPELSDEMAAAENIEGVSDRNSLIKHLQKQTLETGVTNEFYGAFVGEFIEKCEFEIADEDIAEMIECEMERCRGISKTMNLVFDEMTEDQLMGAVGCKTIADFKKMIEGVYNRNLRVALVSAGLDGKDGSVLTYENVPDYFMELRDKTVALAIDNILNQRGKGNNAD